MTMVPTFTLVFGMMLMLSPFYTSPRRFLDIGPVASVLQRVYPPARMRVSDDSRAMVRHLRTLDDL